MVLSPLFQRFVTQNIVLLFLCNPLFDGCLNLDPFQGLSPAQFWLRNHYPSLLTAKALQQHYDDLLKGYEVPQTGLFLSFPETSDQRLVQQASTYDQGVMGILLLKLHDFKRVAAILRFYQHAWQEAKERSGPRKNVFGFANFYNAYYGVEGVEKTMHVGPNVWIGLLASRYYRRTGEIWARDLALEIARWEIRSVPHTDGAVAMGEIPWNGAPWSNIYSTENNISTYAFLSDLLKGESLPPADMELIRKERKAIGRWLLTKAYHTDQNAVIRGFNPGGVDDIPAVDSYTWYIDALRPGTFEKMGIPLRRLMKRLHEEFLVKVGRLKGIDCVDQRTAKATYEDALHERIMDPNWHRPEGDDHRLIWYEGTGQFIVALQDMAVHAVNQAFELPEGPQRDRVLGVAEGWLQEAKEYADAMDAAAFRTEASGVSYPLATRGRFYLFGWPAPQPARDHPANAVAPLAWRIFAGMGYEPLSDTDLKPSGKWYVKKASYHYETVRDPGTEILYGASEEMSIRAWQLFESGLYDKAWRQSRATIHLWEEDAGRLEARKEKAVGGFLFYDGTVASFQRIHDYWALNDVAASYFVCAEICDREGRYQEAKIIFSHILKDFTLAQIWDKRGWFWTPAETIAEDFIAPFPERYSELMADVPETFRINPRFIPGWNSTPQAMAAKTPQWYYDAIQ